MNRYLTLMCICILVMLTSTVSAEDIIMEESTIAPIKTILPENTILPANDMLLPGPVISEKAIVAEIVYQEKEVTISTRITNLKNTIGEIVGITPDPTSETTIEVDVIQEDQILATIPADSPFNGIEVHAVCLEYQYGTTNWFECEQRLQ